MSASFSLSPLHFTHTHYTSKPKFRSILNLPYSHFTLQTLPLPLSMYATSSSSAFAAATTATAIPADKRLFQSPAISIAAGPRRRVEIKASISTFPESIRVDPRKSTLSLYEILRVNPTASPMEIKTAYRTLAKIYHPDAIHHHDDPDLDCDEEESDGRDFIVIHNAYETLSDPIAREVYDMSLSARNYYRAQRAGGYSSGFYATRRWETDQCW